MTPRPHRRAAAAAVMVAACTIASPTTASAQPETWRYTMVAFSNASDRDLDVYESSDGTSFTAARTSAYRPPSGVVRDPSIIRHTDGLYHLTYTTVDGATIGFATSPDRLTWTFGGNHPLPLCCAFLPGTGDGRGVLDLPLFGSAGSSDGPSLSPFTTKAWAPEWFVDGDAVHVIVSLSTGGGFVPHLLTAQNESLTSWSAPVPMAGLGADRIDTTVVKVGSEYHAFTKNETKKTIEHLASPTLVGPYRPLPPGDWGALREGPAVVQLPDGAWRLYLDAYTEGRYLYSDSGDGLRTWTEPRELLGVSGTVRHIGVLREPA